MAEDWSADVKKYVSNPDVNAIASIVRYCGIALQGGFFAGVVQRQGRSETRTENFLKKKLGLTNPDAELDAAIKAVSEKKSDQTKNRVTVYYLLAEHFGKLPVLN